ncbi:MAG: phosphate/phosphite/phosphonate ABC transporter substrate-binding protein [Deltaproteobacteria bacterium]|nr:phosphate/phosphite/phosphonate ABC transporter substrate-binding protein [Deltaproteobacteria bacterium]MBL7216393.1 phosphate/phosphite/phosphonate ABC transporter substrate-binding protein [Desulfobacteraceae bacterium]
MCLSIRRIILSFVVALLYTINLYAAEPARPLEIGVLPYINIEGLIKAYKPLTDYLEKALSRPVLLVSAKDYAHYLQLTTKKSYDLIITASHFARMAQLEGTYEPLFRPLTTYHEVIVTKKGSPVARIADLKGRRIAIPNRLAQTTILGRQMLKSHNIDPDVDVTLIDALSHKNAIYYVLNGEADAAIISTGGYRHSSDDVKKDIVILQPREGYIKDRPVAIPLIYMVSRDLPPELRDQIVQSISHFANSTEEGKDWIINKRRYKGLRAPTPEEMKSLDSHVEELRSVLKTCK